MARKRTPPSPTQFLPLCSTDSLVEELRKRSFSSLVVLHTPGNERGTQQSREGDGPLQCWWEMQDVKVYQEARVKPQSPQMLAERALEWMKKATGCE